MFGKEAEASVILEDKHPPKKGSVVSRAEGLRGKASLACCVGGCWFKTGLGPERETVILDRIRTYVSWKRWPDGRK